MGNFRRLKKDKKTKSGCGRPLTLRKGILGWVIGKHSIAKHTKVDMIWVAGRSPTLVSYSLRGVAMNLKATTLTYLAIVLPHLRLLRLLFDANRNCRVLPSLFSTISMLQYS